MKKIERINTRKFLIDNNLDDLILNDRTNTAPKDRVYVSDALNLYAKAIEQYVQSKLTEKYDINDYLQLVDGWAKLKGYVKKEDVIKARTQGKIDILKEILTGPDWSTADRIAELEKELK